MIVLGLTVEQAILLLQDNLAFYEDKKKNFGFYINAKNTWLDNSKQLGTYKGLKYLVSWSLCDLSS